MAHSSSSSRKVGAFVAAPSCACRHFVVCQPSVWDRGAAVSDTNCIHPRACLAIFGPFIWTAATPISSRFALALPAATKIAWDMHSSADRNNDPHRREWNVPKPCRQLAMQHEFFGDENRILAAGVKKHPTSGWIGNLDYVAFRPRHGSAVHDPVSTAPPTRCVPPR
jgi:hypothetical protein